MAKKVCPNAESCDRDMPESTTVDVFFWKMKDLSLISLSFAPTIQKSKNPKIKTSKSPKIQTLQKSKNQKNKTLEISKNPKIQTLEIGLPALPLRASADFQSLDFFDFCNFGFLFCLMFGTWDFWILGFVGVWTFAFC